MNRNLTILVLAAAALALLGCVALAEDSDAIGGNIDGVQWTLEDGTLTISTTGSMPNYTKNSAPWKAYAESITSAIIGDGVSSIGNYAFYNCSNLTSVEIPEGVTHIGNYAFYWCSSLESVTIPERVYSIGSEAFEGCSSMESVTIPERVEDIPFRAFAGCSSLESVDILEGVKTIGGGAFQGCSSLVSVSLPASLTTLSTSTFKGCVSLADISVPDESQNFTARNGLVYDKELSMLIIASKDVTSVELPEGVTSIWDYAFEGCSSLESVDIPSTVTSIGGRAFYGCTSLATITLSEENESFALRDGALYDAEIETLILLPTSWTGPYTPPETVEAIESSAFQGCAAMTSVAVPEGVEYIDSDYFIGCTALETVSLPSTCSVDYNPFFGCTSLREIKVADENEHLSVIGGALFYIAPGETELLSFPPAAEAVSYDVPRETYVASLAFAGCSSLERLSLDMAYVESLAFAGCGSLRWVWIGGESWINEGAFSFTAPAETKAAPDGITFYDTDGETILSEGELPGYLYIGEGDGRLVRQAGIDLGSNMLVHLDAGIPTDLDIPVPEGATISVELADGLTFDGETLTADRPGLYTLGITVEGEGTYGKAVIRIVAVGNGEYWVPEGVEVAPNAFDGCEWLRVVHVPSQCYIDQNIFAGCPNLERIEVYGEGFMTSVDGVLFEGSSDQLLVAYPAAKEGARYEIPDGTAAIAVDAFNGCRLLEEVSIPASITEIYDPESEYSSVWPPKNPFAGCTSLRSVTVAEGNNDIVSMDGVLFYYGALITYPAAKPDDSYAVSDCDISPNAFSGCTHLKTITLAATVYEVESGTFSGCTSLESIAVAEDNMFLMSVDGVLFSKDGSELIAYPAARAGDSYAVPEGVYEISPGAFDGCTSLRTIELPATMSLHDGRSYTMELENPFAGCMSLESFSVDEGNNAMASVDGVLFSKDGSELIAYPAARAEESYEIPEGTTTIYEDAFDGCSLLRSISLPSTLDMSSFGYEGAILNPFKGCASLESISVADGHDMLHSEGGALFARTSDGGDYGGGPKASGSPTDMIDGDILIAYPAGNRAESYEVPESVIMVSPRAFDGCTHLRSVSNVPLGFLTITTMIREGPNIDLFVGFGGCSGLRELRGAPQSLDLGGITIVSEPVGDGVLAFALTMSETGGGSSDTKSPVKADPKTSVYTGLVIVRVPPAWISTSAVSFVSEGEEVGSVDATATVRGLSAYPVDLPSEEWAGHDLTGWTDGENTYIGSRAILDLSGGDVVLTAVWDAHELSLDVSPTAEVAVGDRVEMAVTVHSSPAGASPRVTAVCGSSGLDASISGGKLVLRALAPGTYRVTVTAEAEGYLPATATVSVTAGVATTYDHPVVFLDGDEVAKVQHSLDRNPGESDVRLSQPDLHRDGKRLAGWSWTEGGPAELRDGDTVKASQDGVTLHAVWEDDTISQYAPWALVVAGIVLAIIAALTGMLLLAPVAAVVTMAGILELLGVINIF